MGVPQFFITTTSSSSSSTSRIELSERDAHHVGHVLRLDEGDHVHIVFSDTRERFQGILEFQDGRIFVVLGEKVESSSSPSPVHALIFGLSKGKKNDLVIEKATELGVEHLFLCQMIHSVARLKGETGQSNKQQRFLKIAEAAAKQSKRNSIPKITLLTSIQELAPFMHETSRHAYCCSLAPTATHISQCSPPKDTGCILAVGPEGDFAPAENQWLKENNFQLVSLGRNVLRSETAAITAIAMITAIHSLNTL